MKIRIGRTAMTFIIAILLVLLIPLGTVTYLFTDEQVPKDVTTTYVFDPVRENWVKQEVEVKLEPNADGTFPQAHNTLIIRLDENNPIKLIYISEALVMHGLSEPLLEINGHDTGGTGQINIGKLLIKDLDAEELKIDDNVDVVNLTLTNVAAEDDELDVDVHAVNVIRTGRGGVSSLFIGQSRKDLNEIQDVVIGLESSDVFALTSRETGIKVDRIRILGPSAGTAYVEDLFVTRTSVFGRFEVSNANIRDLTIKNVQLDDDP